MFIARIIVTLRTSILDPQGKAVHHALESLGLGDVHDVRIGKHVQMKIESASLDDARRITEEACKKLIASPVMEEYSFTVEKA